MRRSSMVVKGAVIGGALAASLTFGVGAAAAQGQTQSPGYSNASTTGACHGVFGEARGMAQASDPTAIAAMAPLKNVNGQDNAVGSCPYQGEPAPAFPPGHPA